MTETGSLPASGLTVRVHSAVANGSRVSRFPKGSGLLILLSLAPLVIAGLVVSLLLKEPLLFLAGMAIVVTILVVTAQHQKSVSRRLYCSTSADWMSPIGFYVGPFDGVGLSGAATFESRNGRAGNPPQVRLVATNHGLSFGPAGHSGSAMTMLFSEIMDIDLTKGTNPRKHGITPLVAAQRGQIVVTTTQGTSARFSGIPIEGVQAALEVRGATIEAVHS